MLVSTLLLVACNQQQDTVKAISTSATKSSLLSSSAVAVLLKNESGTAAADLQNAEAPEAVYSETNEYHEVAFDKAAIEKMTRSELTRARKDASQHLAYLSVKYSDSVQFVMVLAGEYSDKKHRDFFVYEIQDKKITLDSMGDTEDDYATFLTNYDMYLPSE